MTKIPYIFTPCNTSLCPHKVSISLSSLLYLCHWCTLSVVIDFIFPPFSDNSFSFVGASKLRLQKKHLLFTLLSLISCKAKGKVLLSTSFAPLESHFKSFLIMLHFIASARFLIPVWWPNPFYVITKGSFISSLDCCRPNFLPHPSS